MRTLLSWMAYQEDFLSDTEVNKTGPHFMFYQHHLEDLRDIHKHLVLYITDNEIIDRRQKVLTQRLKRETIRLQDRKLVVNSMGVAADAFDAPSLFQLLDEFIVQSRGEKFTAMINTGTKDMHTVWHLLAARYPEQLDLISIVDPQYSQNKTTGDRRTNIKLIEDVLPSAFSLRQSSTSPTDFVDFQPAARQRAISIAASPNTTVLIQGAHGTGKESLAKTVHDHSTRKGKPYIVRNCAGYTDELLRSELFGYTKGAFTGATHDRQGIFEMAKGGTVFLDEIGDISPFMQVNLLRVLQNKTIVPVGSSQERQIDVRIIAATNKDLIAECEAGRFRWDLFYRLAVAEIQTTPISAFSRAKKNAIINHFLQKFQQEFKSIRPTTLTLHPSVLQHLQDYSFPGNIRELENLIESLFTHPEQEITLEHLPPRILHTNQLQSELLSEIIKNHCNRIYEKYGRNQTKAMAALGIKHPNTFKKYRDGKH